MGEKQKLGETPGEKPAGQENHLRVIESDLGGRMTDEQLDALFEALGLDRDTLLDDSPPPRPHLWLVPRENE